MDFQLHLIRKTRENFFKLMDGLSIDSLNKVPEGFNNNIVWNFGHILVSQQILCYHLSGLRMQLDPELIRRYRKGSKPEAPVGEAELEQLKNYAVSTADQLEKDLKEGVFQNFNEYLTSYGLVLTSIGEAVAYNAQHESLHLGYAMALKKLV
ncbi:DinB family protein [Cesiribacter sp. SM1]|uniref:DinB family protein n=1 Tax=Cesiribacter sp. SM1 TaxID=2861196 RepID=UPI001CD5D95F|nr:DinB family protein [Cesiribacter sp. SM1]